MDKLIPPNFKDEGEEADWWPKQEGRIADALEQAATSGTLQRGVQSRKGAIAPTTIRLDPKDIERARAQAEQRGLKYQTYLKMLIHEALRQEEKHSAR